MFTKEQLEEIEKKGYVKHFITCLQSGFKRGTFRSEDEWLADEYDKASEYAAPRNFGCKSCNFNFYKKAAELYYESKKYYEKEDNNKAKKETEKEMSEKVTPSKPKTKTHPKPKAKKSK